MRTLRREGVLAMPPGRALDALVAELVVAGVRPYSTDVGAAWDVLAALAVLGFDFDLSRHHNFSPGGPWRLYWQPGGGWAAGDDAPAAVCRGALLAVGRASDREPGVLVYGEASRG